MATEPSGPGQDRFGAVSPQTERLKRNLEDNIPPPPLGLPVPPDNQFVSPWSDRADVVALRRNVPLAQLRASVVVFVLIFLICLVYFGAASRTSAHIDDVPCIVVSFDSAGGLVGNEVLAAVASWPTPLQWEIHSASDFGSASDAVARVNNGDVWCSIIVNSGASQQISGFLAALQQQTTSLPAYNPAAAVQYVFDEGRNSASVSAFILPQLQGVVGIAQSAITSSVLRAVLAGLSSSPPLYNATYLSSQPAVASFLTAPVIADAVDLHPPFPYVFQLTITLGYIYMWIIAGASVGAIIGISKQLEGHLLVQYVVGFRTVANLCNNFFLSFIFSAVTTWMSGAHWYADVFFRFWFFNWLAMNVFTAVIALFTAQLGALAQAGLTVFLVFNLASAGQSVALELEPAFFRIGYGLPLYQCLSAARSILYGSHTNMVANVLILFGWWVAAVTLLVLSVVHRTRAQQEWMRIAKAEEAAKAEKADIELPAAAEKDLENQTSGNKDP